MAVDHLIPEFVTMVPENPVGGILYISIEYATAAHLCVCGCGREVMTPLTPTDWKLIFDGESISLHPSVGNWSFPCRSHYWISNNRVRWAAPMNQWEIDAGRALDRERKLDYFQRQPPLLEPSPPHSASTDAPQNKPRSWLERIVDFWTR